METELRLNVKFFNKKLFSKFFKMQQKKLKMQNLRNLAKKIENF